jgi:hypothetical protein
MKNRSQLISILLLVLLFVAFIIRRWNEPVKKEAFDRYPVTLTYSKHARCRMQCRQIDENEVQEIMHKGIINFNKSNRRDRPCPTFALQGQTSSGERLRIIFAQCPSKTTVVTCYNLEEEFSCDCPGDEKKNRN